MSFLDKHFITVWLAIIVTIMASIALFFFYAEAQSAPGGAGFSWYLIGCALVAGIAPLLPVALYVQHRLSQRLRLISRDIVETFE